MGVFEKFFKNQNNNNNNKENMNYPREQGVYLCEFDRIILKNDESNDTILFLFMGKLIKDKVIGDELFSVIIKFNFYNKNDKTCELFIKSIYKIIYCYTNDDALTKNILSKPNNLAELKQEILKYLNPQLKVCIKLIEKTFNNKKYYLVDLLDDFIYRYNDTNTNQNNDKYDIDFDNLEFDDVPF